MTKYWEGSGLLWVEAATQRQDKESPVIDRWAPCWLFSWQMVVFGQGFIASSFWARGRRRQSKDVIKLAAGPTQGGCLIWNLRVSSLEISLLGVWGCESCFSLEMCHFGA